MTRRRVGVAVVVWGGLIAGCASRQQQAAPVVDDLHLTGNSALSDRQIKKKILTGETGWWPFARKHLFDPVAWQADLKRIERLYVAHGYYQAEVVRDQVTPTPPTGVTKTVALGVQISEGPPTRVGTLKIEGLEAVAEDDRTKVLESLPLVPGKTFTEADWEAAKDQLGRRLRARGYAKAKVEGQALVDVGTHAAALTLQVNPGLRYRFGDVEVSTAPDAQIPAAYVWEQVRLAVPEGTLYSDEALREAERRVFGMGLFATARVGAGDADDASMRIAVRVSVRESAFRTVRIGGGARIDQVRNEARAIGEWTHRNFLGGMRKLTLHGEVGWAFIPDAYAVYRNRPEDAPRSGPLGRLQLTFEQPRLLGRPSLRSVTKLESDRTLEQTYNALANRFQTGVIWLLRSRLSIYPAYNLEADYLSGSPVSGVATAPLTLGCDTSLGHCLVWLSYLEETVTWDLRNNTLEPLKGLYLSLSLQQGGGPLQGDFTYLRALPDARAYVSFGGDDALTLATRLRVGGLWPSSGNPDDSAVVTRFYAGGSNSMRGFNERRLSPLLLAPAPNDPSVLITVPIGGNGMIDGSFEARYSVTPSLRVAAFVDYGEVTRGRLGPRDIPNLLWAVGVGVRYLTPVGPIRLDLARRLPFGALPALYQVDAAGAIVQVPYRANDSCFGFGGSTSVVTDGLCALHISIGEAY